VALDLSTKRELNSGFGNALETAVELAVTPAVFALIGWRLDVWLDTSPILLISLFAFVMGYVIWKHLTKYDAAMRRRESEIPGLRAHRSADREEAS
jgi:F0F1-type ATP synthase assembly protein I